ncbi:MAG TPA: hypothetical protein VF669_06200 [Tepidisphaeraceae bacterium]
MAKRVASRRPEARGTEPRGGRESFEGAADPAATNRERPGRVGQRESVPGAGSTRAGADAGPKGRAGRERQNYPGKTAAAPTQRSPGARRAGTTRSGAASPATSRGGGDVGARSGDDREATEAVTGSASQGAPLGVPGTMGPTGASGLREVADPNFPISQRKEAKRERKVRGEEPADQPSGMKRRKRRK